MKIVFLNIYQDLVDRGAETFVYEISKRLAKNHQVTVICGGESKKPYKILKIAGFNIYPTDKPDLIWRLLHKFYLDPYSRQIYQFTKKAIPYIIKEKPDWVIPLNGFWQLFQIKNLQKKNET
jgi:glycosyltransferase involved in cell wall biosynthesis